MQIKTVNQGSKKNHFSLFEYSRLKILKMVARCKILLGKKEGNFVQYQIAYYTSDHTYRLSLE